MTTVACAVFAARGAASLAAAELDAPPGPHGAAPVVQIAKPPAVPAPNPDVLVERDIFCSSCTPEIGTHEPGSTGPSSAKFGGAEARLIATSLGKRPRATVAVPGIGGGGDFEVGDRIATVGTVVRIGPSSIDVQDTAGALETLSLRDAISAATSGSQGAATPSPDAAANHPYADRISKRADGSYDVDRSLVRELVSGAAKPGGVRLMPVMDGDKVAGVKVLGARPGTIAAALEMKSGDVIAQIDGKALTNAQQLIDLLAALDQTEQVTVGGTRGKTPLTRTLHLR